MTYVDRLRRCVWCGACLVGLCATAQSVDEPVAFVVVGYLPSYRFESCDARRLTAVTDVILFSIEPRTDGTLNSQRLPVATIAPLGAKLAAQGSRVLVTIGGWGHSAEFSTVTADEETRRQLVQNLLRFCEQHQLDGVDVDWEHPRTNAERAQLGEFLTELKAALGPQRLVTIAVAPWERLAPATIAAVDRVHLMAYDNGGRHSTLAYSNESVHKLLQAGVPAQKLCLGMPFYGRPFEGEFGAATTYGELAARHAPAAAVDEVAGVYFNGPATVAAKVQLAREHKLAGVMIWELGQDASDPERSLLECIRRAAVTPADDRR